MQVIVGQLMLDDARQIMQVFFLKKKRIKFQLVAGQQVAATGSFQAAVDSRLMAKGPAEGFQGNFLNQLLQFLFINHGTIVASYCGKNQLLLFIQQDTVFHS